MAKKKTAKKKVAKKKAAPVAVRVAKTRAKQKAGGSKQVNLQIPEVTIRRLDRKCKKQGVTRSELVTSLIKAA